MSNEIQDIKALSTSEKLEKAKRLIEEAASLVEAANAENEQLKDEYDLEVLHRDLLIIASNPKAYQNVSVSIEEILGDFGDKWNDA